MYYFETLICNKNVRMRIYVSDCNIEAQVNYNEICNSGDVLSFDYYVDLFTDQEIIHSLKVTGK